MLNGRPRSDRWEKPWGLIGINRDRSELIEIAIVWRVVANGCFVIVSLQLPAFRKSKTLMDCYVRSLDL